MIEIRLVRILELMTDPEEVLQYRETSIEGTGVWKTVEKVTRVRKGGRLYTELGEIDE
jgi:hypothetical protein